MPKLQGLIFDLDGTLIDSAPDLCQAMNKILAENGRRPVTLDEVKSFVGDGMLTMMQRALAATGNPLPDNETFRIFQKFVGYYRDLPAAQEQIYPHVRETLENFIAKGVKLGLCTNKQETATKRLLKDLDMARYFTFVAGGDTFALHKPHPDHVKGVVEKMGVPALGCVMVGDSVNDVSSAKGNDIPCLIVTHGYGFEVEELGAAALIEGIDQLPAALQGIGFQ
jgi:phosphoglycolate phosphatase